jgi:8-oxo-dGTP diphosphatase
VVGVERERRISAYGVCRDADRVLLVRASPLSPHTGSWLLPGGGIEHGEDPAQAVVREVVEETGVLVEISGVRAVLADVIQLHERPVSLHFDRVIYDVVPRGGRLRAEERGTTDQARWLTGEELATLALLPFTAAALGIPVTPRPEDPDDPDRLVPVPGPPPGRRGRRGQRFAAYGVVTDPAERVLLTRIAEGFPGAGRWHLPGGGTDFGEQPAAALLRELAEETNQVGVVTDLLSVSHRHSPRALGPEGHPIDWHTVRAVYRVEVAMPTEPRVTEAAGGSTAAAAWFRRPDVGRLPLTEVALGAFAE